MSKPQNKCKVIDGNGEVLHQKHLADSKRRKQNRQDAIRLHRLLSSLDPEIMGGSVKYDEDMGRCAFSTACFPNREVGMPVNKLFKSLKPRPAPDDEWFITELEPVSSRKEIRELCHRAIYISKGFAVVGDGGADYFVPFQNGVVLSQGLANTGQLLNFLKAMRKQRDDALRQLEELGVDTGGFDLPRHLDDRICHLEANEEEE